MAKCDAKFRSPKFKETSDKLGNELGLYLLVNPVGSKYWRRKFRIAPAVRLSRICVRLTSSSTRVDDQLFLFLRRN